jgi:hypothetical protein
LELGLKVDDEGDDEDPRDFKSGVESFQCVCLRLIRVCVVDMHIMREQPNYSEFQRIAIVH